MLVPISGSNLLEATEAGTYRDPGGCPDIIGQYPLEADLLAHLQLYKSDQRGGCAIPENIAGLGCHRYHELAAKGRLDQFVTANDFDCYSIGPDGLDNTGECKSGGYPWLAWTNSRASSAIPTSGRAVAVGRSRNHQRKGKYQYCEQNDHLFHVLFSFASYDTPLSTEILAFAGQGQSLQSLYINRLHYESILEIKERRFLSVCGCAAHTQKTNYPRIFGRSLLAMDCQKYLRLESSSIDQAVSAYLKLCLNQWKTMC
jgi:hypothetical protein